MPQKRYFILSGNSRVSVKAKQVAENPCLASVCPSISVSTPEPGRLRLCAVIFRLAEARILAQAGPEAGSVCSCAVGCVRRQTGRASPLAAAHAPSPCAAVLVSSSRRPSQPACAYAGWSRIRHRCAGSRQPVYPLGIGGILGHMRSNSLLTEEMHEAFFLIAWGRCLAGLQPLEHLQCRRRSSAVPACVAIAVTTRPLWFLGLFSASWKAVRTVPKRNAVR